LADPDMPRLQGKCALITGAGAGIGRSIAVLFASEGAQVAIVDQDATGAAETRGQIEQQGGRGRAFTADVSRSAEVAQVVREIGEHFGALHILINNAGITGRRSFADLAEKEWDRVMAVNLKGAMLFSQQALPLLKKQPGSKIVNIASVELSHHSPKLTAYAASKGGLASLSRALALELARHKINVNYICPGMIRSDMTRRYLKRWLFRKYIEHRTPLGRLGEPEDVARVALFLASDDAEFITGAGITVDGGLSLRLF